MGAQHMDRIREILNALKKKYPDTESAKRMTAAHSRKEPHI